MKKIIFLLALAIGFIAPAGAQTSFLNGSFISSYSGNPVYTKLDTVSNTGTDTFKIKVSGYVRSITFQVNITKISGTLGGTVKVFASADNGNSYAQINSSYTVTDGSQVYQYPINTGNGNPYTNYWIVWTGTGTMSGSWLGNALFRN